MTTLRDYSDLCRRLDDALNKVARQIDFPIKRISACPELFQLESDGMVVINGFDYKDNGSFKSVKITKKGREFLNRGGYCNFNQRWQPSLFD